MGKREKDGQKLDRGLGQGERGEDGQEKEGGHRLACQNGGLMGFRTANEGMALLSKQASLAAP